MGRDTIGSLVYGSFTYKGACPTTTGPLPGVSVHAATTNDAGKCFTDDSIAATSTGDIGYICEESTTPGNPATIYFSYPGSAGFIVGGYNFVAAGTSDTAGYVWGSIGLPTYDLSIASCTASCSASCTVKYCSPSCTAVCTSSPSCVATDPTPTCSNSNAGANAGGTTYFLPSGFSPDNCGTGAGFCCNEFAYPKPEGYRFYRIKCIAIKGGASDTYWQLSEFNLRNNGARVPSIAQFTLQNDGTWPNGGSPNGEDVTKVDDASTSTKYLAFHGAGTSIVLDFGTAQSFDQYDWYTANDNPHRDMKSWILMGSNDNNLWTDIDTQTNYAVTSDRYASVGTFAIIYK